MPIFLLNSQSRRSLLKAGLVMLFILSIAAGMVYYQKTFSMEIITEMEINDPSLKAKVLVASQGSAYKREVTANVVDAFREAEVFIKVIDVTKLTNIEPSKWDAIVIMHTWEMWKPEINSASFIKKTVDKDKLIVLATSGSGEEMMDEVDGITSASVLSTATTESQEIIQRIKDVLSEKYNRSYSGVLEEY